MIRENNTFLKASKCLRESQTEREENRLKRIIESCELKERFVTEYHNIMDSREQKERRHSQLLEAARDNALSTALKAIYITALEAATLTDEAILLAENMVDNWIKEKGGASVILGECENNTYFLSRLSQIVEDAAQDDVKEIEKDPADIDFEDDKKSDDKKDEEAPKDDKKEESENKEEKESTEEKSEDKKDEEAPKDDKKEESEKGTSEDNPLNVSDFNSDEEVPAKDNDPSDDQTDAAEEIIDDIEVDDTPVSVDGEGQENQGKVFDELEKEEDVRKAIELIRQRVADAEEAFIKRNAEDKRQIDELLAKISDNVKTVEDLSDDGSDESQAAQESAMMNRRKIQNITENRPLTILERMTRNLCSSIIKDNSIKEHYVTESGDLDTHLVFESAKVMYGFLETLSTLKLEKVDSAYITKVLDEM